MKREMTDEIRRKLAGLLPFAPGSLLPFTPEAFLKVEEPFRPRIFLRDFPASVRKELDGKIAQEKLDRESMAWALSEGDEKSRACAGWDNLLSIATGEPVPYSVEEIKRLPDHTLSACFWKAMEFSGMTVLEKEGLGSLPASTSEQSSNHAESAPVLQS